MWAYICQYIYPRVPDCTYTWVHGEFMPLCVSLGWYALTWTHECERVWACVRLFVHAQLCDVVRLWVQGWACDTASLLAAVTVPVPFRVECGRWQGRGGGEAEGTDLGHDRSSRGCCDARLHRLYWLGGSLGRGLGGRNHGGLLRSRHCHSRCHRALLEEQRKRQRDKQDMTLCSQQGHREQEAGATALLSHLVSWL